MCKITINNDRELEVKGGNHLLGSLLQNGIFIPSPVAAVAARALQGKGDFEAAAFHRNPYLTKEEQEDNIRLSCQVKVREDVAIEIPEELFSIRNIPQR